MRKSQEITPLLAKRAGRPVRCVNSREETFDFLMKERYMYLKVGFKNNGLITAIDDFSISDGGSQGSSSFGTANDQGYGPYYTFRCKNIRQTMEIVDSNRGKMYLSGQHCPFNWDAGTMAIYLIAEKWAKTRLTSPSQSSRSRFRMIPDPYPALKRVLKKASLWTGNGILLVQRGFLTEGCTAPASDIRYARDMPFPVMT